MTDRPTRRLSPTRQQDADTNRSACLQCSQAIEVGPAQVQCGLARQPIEYAFGRCKLRKWPSRPPALPGVWVLGSPATGSSYLCAMLNRLGFNPGLNAYGDAYVMNAPSAPPPNADADPLVFESHRLSLQQVISRHPDTRFVLMRRRDLLACAVDRYVAERAQTWRLHPEFVTKPVREADPVSLDEDWLRACYRKARHDDGYWVNALKHIGRNAHVVWYEDLLAQPAACLADLLTSLGIDDDPAWAASGVPTPDGVGERPESCELRDRLESMLDNIGGAGGLDGTYKRLDPKRFVVGVLSCRETQYQARRAACQRIWGAKLESAGVEVLYLIGLGDAIEEPCVVSPAEHGRIGRELQIPCPDTYDALPQKTAAFCRWACQSRHFEYLFKCDDDTYLVPDRLLAVEPNADDYLGSRLYQGVRYASGGGGYFLSRRAAAIIAEHMTELEGAEDALVGEHLARRGIYLRPDSRFVSFGTGERFPKPGNDLITCHAYERPWAEHDVIWGSV